MKYAVLGTGAVGSSLCGQILLAGRPVVLIAHSPEKMEEINREGLRLTIQGAEGSFSEVRLPAAAVTDARAAGKADVILLATKAIHNPGALDSIRALWKENSILLTCQNGLDTTDCFQGALPPRRISTGVVYFGGRVNPDGSVLSLMGAPPHLLVRGDDPETGPVLARMEEELRPSGFGLRLCGRREFDRVFWKKLILNVAASSVCALERITHDQLGASESGVELCMQLARECCAVAEAEGVLLRPEDVPLLPTRVTPVAAGKVQHYPSMAADAMAGRPTENEFFSGAVVRLAHARGVPVPRLETVYQLCRLMEEQF